MYVRRTYIHGGKLKKLLPILIALLVILACCTLYACNGQNNVEPQAINVENNTIVSETSSISGTAAWNMIKQAALNSVPSQGGFLNFNTLLGLDLKKNGNGNTFQLRVAGSINQQNTEDSRLLLQLDKFTPDDPNNPKKVLGIYYVDGVCYADLTGLKKGAVIVRTEDIDLGYVAERIHHMFEGTSIGDIFYNTLLGLDVGKMTGIAIIGTLESLLDIILPKKVDVVELSDGSTQISMPFQLEELMGVVLGVLGGFLSDEIKDMVFGILGLDLNKLNAVVPNEVQIIMGA